MSESAPYFVSSARTDRQFITICKYDDYQIKELDTNQQTNQQLTSNQPATNQQLTTNKNVKNIIQGNLEIRRTWRRHGYKQVLFYFYLRKFFLKCRQFEHRVIRRLRKLAKTKNLYMNLTLESMYEKK